MSYEMKPRFTFHDVLWNWDDQVTVRQLLEELVPEDVKSMIVVRFNQHVEQYNSRRKTV